LLTTTHNDATRNSVRTEVHLVMGGRLSGNFKIEASEFTCQE
jgi:hypothetical protein